MSTLGFETHDHSGCIQDSLTAMELHCKAKGLRLTPVRRRVLEILLAEHRAMGAYDILDRLRAEGLGSQPPVVYRALDFLVENRFVHKIERLNAFIACDHPGEQHAPAFLICRTCDAVAEAHADLAEGRLGQVAEAAGFTIERTVVEAEGLCPKCQEVSA
ncbi:transcriptional repressor [Aestuariivita sp.]|jgi:Fur family zinc uptake transcriptional regulator|uniref:transcriptional repressor n=1 Tax=Aestuariivita sp. TaxID=1872407 RepID=UPI0021739AF9|nr:transcriptional repressor [Aestuariivita sp.]MCE8009461.1 transcriptional repressor [Aestuariivita sp.]